MILTPFITLFWLSFHFVWILFWPLINLLKNYFTLGQYRTAVGEAKTAKHIQLEKNRTQSVRAHMFEVCIESTFQVKFKKETTDFLKFTYSLFSAAFANLLVFALLLEEFSLFFIQGNEGKRNSTSSAISSHCHFCSQPYIFLHQVLYNETKWCHGFGL